MGYRLSPEEIVVANMTGAVPERNDEIQDLWKQYHPNVILTQDANRITLNATKDRIKFDAKTMEVFWLIGFSGWRAIECYSPHVLITQAVTRPIILSTRLHSTSLALL
jgi:hypothetical protein